MQFFSPGVIAAVLAVIATIAGALGKPQLAAFLGSPEAATAFNAVVTSAGVILAGVLPGIKKAA
jgi:hypothetical protein